MSNIARVAGQAANTLTAPLNVEEVFSTYLYTGNGSTQTITNGIDLSGEGGLVWTKQRTGAASSNVLVDTERGVNAVIYSDLTNAEYNSGTNTLTAFNNNGYDLGSNTNFNRNNEDNVSWTFRKAPKFFDVVTYTGNGTAGRTVSHNLGSVPGCIIVKCTSNSSTNWAVYHRGVASDAETDFLRLNLASAAEDNAGYWNDTAPTSTEFTVGNSTFVNNSSYTYVAYLFAHNDGDGEFGPNGDADIIKCGSYTGGTAPISVDLGFEPQWILIKGAVGSTQNWVLFDTMRGIATGGADEYLSPNVSNAETTFSTDYIDVTSTGFEIKQSNNAFVSQNSATYIYIAIRRGPMAVPTDATDVFGMSYAEDSINGTFPVDAVITKTTPTASDHFVRDRLRGGKYLSANRTNAETTNTAILFDDMTGLNSSGWGTDYIHWMWRRAPNYFDVVAYTGEGTKQTITHNLGVAPEMMWIKVRSTTQHWAVYHPDLPGSGNFISLNNNWDGNNTNSNFWDGETPTSTTFSVGATGVNNTYVNGSGSTYIAYLFASLAGVSKVGSYTGNGSTQTIDCGFSAGARFVLIKRTDSTGDWYVWDTERGIVAANDPHLSLNSTAAEVTTDDSIDPVSSGFAVNQVAATNINVSSASYIFYAIA